MVFMETVARRGLTFPSVRTLVRSQVCQLAKLATLKLESEADKGLAFICRVKQHLYPRKKKKAQRTSDFLQAHAKGRTTAIT
jgi:hypothetical protein